MNHSSWPWGSLKPNGYNLIMVDPGWQFKNWSKKGEVKNASSHYRCMTIDEIKALQVSKLANPSGCVLVLWATNPKLDQAFEVMSAWGFTFKTAAAWHKKTKNGKTGFGTGYILRCAHEPLLIGTIGKPKYSKKTRTLFEGPLAQHSEKPDEAYEWAETILKQPEDQVDDIYDCLFPKLKPKLKSLKYCEIFSRKGRAGWDTWGNEAGKFEGTAGMGDLIEKCEAKWV